MRIYEVELVVSGPITINRPINFNTDKELDVGNVFRCAITIKRHSDGIVIASTVQTVDRDRAYKVALLFIGKMLDILAIKTNAALNVSLNSSRNKMRGVSFGQ